tara:strand:+ start:4537 stop:5463 length:927 start_codon:yes stop_codon:yes gene_type:complete
MLKTFSIKNTNGYEATILNYGAILHSFKTPDGTELIVGHPQPEDYLESNTPYYGATIGRVANRIGGASFELEGKIYALVKNENSNHLHGGHKGFDKVFWDAQASNNSVILQYRSTNGEEGYPGNVDITTTYTLSDNNELIIDYSATTDQATPLILTNHAYWNLAGTGNILDHELKVYADHYIELDHENIPTGKILPVSNTHTDFQSFNTLGDYKPGHDQCYDLKNTDKKLKLAAEVIEPKSQRKLTLHTNHPGLQLYTGIHLPEPFKGFCLETQHFPDAMHHENFPNCILKPDELYAYRSIYHLSYSH